MPSNKQYIEQAKELAAELGVEVTTDGLNNEKLAGLVSDLKAKLRDKELETQVDGQQDQDVEEEKLPPYYVEKGKAITTRRGIRSDGQEITASDLAGGEAALEAFVKSGHVGKG